MDRIFRNYLLLLCAGEFCKEMYRSVKNAKLGSVIWSYLKPIISGKVLYTPDTPLAREIIGKVSAWKRAWC